MPQRGSRGAPTYLGAPRRRFYLASTSGLAVTKAVAAAAAEAVREARLAALAVVAVVAAVSAGWACGRARAPRRRSRHVGAKRGWRGARAKDPGTKKPRNLNSGCKQKGANRPAPRAMV